MLATQLANVDPSLVSSSSLDPVEGPTRLSRHLAAVIERALRELHDDPNAQAALVNGVIAVSAAIPDREAERLADPPRVLDGIKRAPQRLGDTPHSVPAPTVPLSTSDLLANAEGQPNIGSELRLELESADSVDLLCAFVIWSGVVRLREPIEGVIARGGRMRVITTTYMGATQRRAVDELVRFGAEVRIAFDARMTKLHAKAWLLERDSGLTTAFIGSSNLSHTALFDGLEWNVRLSSVDARHVDRARPHDVRELLGVGALRVVRPASDRRAPRSGARCSSRPRRGAERLVRSGSTFTRIRISNGCSSA